MAGNGTRNATMNHEYLAQMNLLHAMRVEGGGDGLRWNIWVGKDASSTCPMEHMHMKSLCWMGSRRFHDWHWE